MNKQKKIKHTPKSISIANNSFRIVILGGSRTGKLIYLIYTLIYNKTLIHLIYTPNFSLSESSEEISKSSLIYTLIFFL